MTNLLLGSWRGILGGPEQLNRSDRDMNDWLCSVELTIGLKRDPSGFNVQNSPVKAIQSSTAAGNAAAAKVDVYVLAIQCLHRVRRIGHERRRLLGRGGVAWQLRDRRADKDANKSRGEYWHSKSHCCLRRITIALPTPI